MGLVTIVLNLMRQPLFWLAGLLSYLGSARRIQSERRLFHSAIDPDWRELRRFWGWGLLLGVILSLLSWRLGLVVPATVVFFYQLLGCIALLLTRWLVQPWLPILLALAGGVFLTGSQLSAFSQGFGLVLLGGLAIANGFVSRYYAANSMTPLITWSNRGRRVVTFRLKQLLLVPLVVWVPITGQAWAWPVFHIGSRQLVPMCLPLILGFLLMVRRQSIPAAIQGQWRQQLGLGIVLMGLGLLSVVVPFKVVLVLALVGTAGQTVWQFLKGRHGQLQYTEPFEGVMVLGIRPETPAAKMDLVPGDIILNCNQQAIQDEDSFYAARMLDATYCHLRVQTLSGEIKMTETAIFEDSPHELGIVMLPARVEGA